MEKLILFFFGKIGFILICIIVLGFVFSIVANIIKIKNIKNEVEELTKETILKESQLSLNIYFKLFLLIFVIVGLIIVYIGLSINSDLLSKIIVVLFGFSFIVIPLIILINITIRCRMILKGEYVIIEDILKDKEWISNQINDDAINEDLFYLFFEKYFKKYNKRILVNSKIFNDSKIGDKFYLVFTKKDYFIFNSKNYKLLNKEKIISIDELSNYINIKKFKIDVKKEYDSNIINQKKIKKDFLMQGHKKTIIINILCCILLLVLCYAVFVSKDIAAIVIVTLMTCFWLFMTFIKIKYVSDICKNLKKDKFKIIEDEVTSLDSKLRFKDSNDIISFNFKNYKKIVYANRKEFSDVKIGDKFYLVFVKGEEEPIRVYEVEKYKYNKSKE